MPEHKMTKPDSSHIQSTQAKSGADMSSESFAARAQSAGDRHDNAQRAGSGNPGGQSNPGSSNSGVKK
ncbi:hypothetical protein E4U55_007361 [Claviceps digitariae]|nr:hypothetical protein E4U55_007361 [Claviceps digitariae]